LAALAKIHAREGTSQRGTLPESPERTPQAGNISDLTPDPTPPPPASPQISLTPDQINKQLDSLARVNSGITSLDRLWDDFSGAATHPASFTTESINKALSAWNRMRLLGGSLFANLSDIGLQHPLQLWLQNGLPLWKAFLNPILSAHKLATNKQLNSFLNELGIGIESQFAQLYAQKYADLTGATLDEARKVIKIFTDGKFRAIAQKLEHSLSRKDAKQAAQRLAALAKIHAREGTPQRGNGPEISGKSTQAGPISDLTPEPPPPPPISPPPTKSTNS
jgi:hypothetical protein